MRIIHALALSLMTILAYAEADTHPPAPAGGKPPVNTVCPVDGKKVDGKVAPIAGKTKEGKTVMIAVCGDACAETVRAHSELYADDAVTNRKHEDHAAK